MVSDVTLVATQKKTRQMARLFINVALVAIALFSACDEQPLQRRITLR